MNREPNFTSRLVTLHRRVRRIVAAGVLLAACWAGPAAALDCGTNNGYLCQGTQAALAVCVSLGGMMAF